MISINDREYIVEHFPDGTQKLSTKDEAQNVNIKWKYSDDSEIFTVLALTKNYKQMGKKVSLIMPYVPNARMDRVKTETEVFTLKIFCQIINDAGFDNVTILDVHSNVTLALLDRVNQMDVAKVIYEAALKYLPKDIILYFPDEGSQKRYGEMFPDYRYVIGMKKRDWETGQIKGLSVIDNGIDLKGKTVLMIDDIISYGGSLYYSALNLMGMGVNQIYAYATHTENSILDEERGTLKKLLDNGTVEKLFTTDSIFTGMHSAIQIMEV